LSGLALWCEGVSDGADDVSQTHWLVSARGGDDVEEDDADEDAFAPEVPAVAPTVAARPSEGVS
jgi:hypothetical protein